MLPSGSGSGIGRSFSPRRATSTGSGTPRGDGRGGRCERPFTGRLRAGSDREAAVDHRFVRELGAGSLDDGVFRGYLVRDYAFVAEPVSLGGRAVADAPTMAAKARLATFLDVGTDDEDDCFARSFDALAGEQSTSEDPDLAPEVVRNGEVLGGRLTRFTTVPDGAWHGVVEAHAPCADGEDTDEALALARDNADRAAELLDVAPDRRAVFVNDATIPYQAGGDPSRRVAYCERAAVAVLNALDSEELGREDAVSRGERAALDALSEWTDRRVCPDDAPEPPDI